MTDLSMRVILSVLSALTAITVAKKLNCRMCIYITSVTKKIVDQPTMATAEKVMAYACPRLMRENSPSVRKVCMNIIREIMDSRILVRKIKIKKRLGRWTSFFCSRELSIKYCPDGFNDPKLFNELSKV
ncbi:hypothetical protein Y032_0004g2081 [Ancylostoma ceylanicum]|uniref:Saposin B-type domain-containing protein n=1 Tax=Ancylostoma ceylanicum TaxID=53326 RepID=A0A016VVD8_9BILA|nr:hypothetical protein Y032_0004g2081 [Ancylostoma ceylanicum]